MKKIIIIQLILVLFSCCGRAADLQDLIHETQKMSQKPHQVVMVWWIPTEFWRRTLESNPNLTKAQVSRFVETLDGYSIFAVVAADIGQMGGFKPKDLETVKQSVEFKVGDNVVPMLDSEKVSPDAQNLISMMKPVIGNMLGQFGKSMEFYIYPNGKEGPELVSPLKDGDFTYTVMNETFAWHLPLGSCLPPKVDTKTGQEFPGNYKFNPFTGAKLVEKKS